MEEVEILYLCGCDAVCDRTNTAVGALLTEQLPVLLPAPWEIMYQEPGIRSYDLDELIYTNEYTYNDDFLCSKKS